VGLLDVATKSTQPAHTTYSNLVEDPNDLVGLICYSLYKRDKLDFIERHRVNHGRDPTYDELQVFYQLIDTPGQIEALRTRSATLLEQVTEVVLEEAVQQMEEDFKAKLVAELKVPKSFWRAVGENVVANVMAAGLVTLVVVVLYLSRLDAVPVIGKALGYDVTPTQSK
jgi:hypothetical protein